MSNTCNVEFRRDPKLERSKLELVPMFTNDGQPKLTRRRFLQGAAVVAGGSAVYGVSQRKPRSGAKAKVVVVGGGAAGLSIAARLSRALEHPDITLIDPAGQHFYQPGFTMIAGGVFRPEEVVRPQN